MGRGCRLRHPAVPASVGTARFILVNFIAPLGPAFPTKSGKKFKVWSRTAPLNKLVELVRLLGMLFLSRRDQVDLRAPRFQSAHATPDAEEDEFRDVPKIKPNSATIRTAVFARLVPNE